MCPDAEVWLVDLDRCAGALDAAAAEADLPHSDLARIAATADATARQERVRAHVALRLLIQRLFGSGWRGVPYEIAERGKLILPGLRGDFTLAHTNFLALVGATSRGNIGADIETARPLRISEARRAQMIAIAADMAPGTVLPEDPDARFLQAWVRLEAVAKADGRGVGHILTTLGARGTARAGSQAETGFATGAESSGAESGAETVFATGGAALAGRFRVTDLAAGAGIFAAAATQAGGLEPYFGRFPEASAELGLWAAPRGSGLEKGSLV